MFLLIWTKIIISDLFSSSCCFFLASFHFNGDDVNKMRPYGGRIQATAPKIVSNLRGGTRTFFTDAERHAVDFLQLDAGVGQHLQLHRRERGRFHT